MELRVKTALANCCLMLPGCVALGFIFNPLSAYSAVFSGVTVWCGILVTVTIEKFLDPLEVGSKANESNKE